MIEAIVFAAGIFVSALSGMGIMRTMLGTDGKDHVEYGSVEPPFGKAMLVSSGGPLRVEALSMETTVVNRDDWSATADWVAEAARKGG